MHGKYIPTTSHSTNYAQKHHRTLTHQSLGLNTSTHGNQQNWDRLPQRERLQLSPSQKEQKLKEIYIRTINSNELILINKELTVQKEKIESAE